MANPASDWAHSCLSLDSSATTRIMVSSKIRNGDFEETIVPLLDTNIRTTLDGIDLLVVGNGNGDFILVILPSCHAIMK